jgi:hypothetical protein
VGIFEYHALDVDHLDAPGLIGFSPGHDEVMQLLV